LDAASGTTEVNRFLLAAVLLALSGGAARADGPINLMTCKDLGACLSVGAPTKHYHRPTNDPDLDRAMKWCDDHIHGVYNSLMGGDPLSAYDIPGCAKVETAWEHSESETQRREAAEAAKEAADKAWFDSYVKSLEQQGPRK
jgi:hypothetical protein